MTLVTLSATYGAGGSTIGPRIAERLGVPFLDRAIPATVAERLAVPLKEASGHDEAIGSLFARMALRLAPMGQAFGAPANVPAAMLDELAYCQATEAIVREQAATGDGLILGRAAALILHGEPYALHVRLSGPPRKRVEQAMRLRGIDRATAERELEETDRARETYVRHFYRADARDPRHYHVVLDSTSLDLDACVELIVTAAAARVV
jgi:cytidylate kinase